MCDFCGEMNGQHFPESKRKIGENAPPFHPWCRCTTAPYFEDLKGVGERWMRDPETGKGGSVPADMTYQEWKEIYVDKTSTMEDWEAKHVDKTGESGIINTKRLTKLKEDGSIANPMDADRYLRMKKQLEKRGCSVISAKGDDERWLMLINAEAIADDVGIIHLVDIPSASSFFEETIHFTQIKKYGALKETDFVERAAREVAANRKLLKHGKEYGFTSEDYTDIKNNLSFWESDFLRRVGISYDESEIHREV